jgi:hypothetical protein
MAETRLPISVAQTQEALGCFCSNRPLPKKLPLWAKLTPSAGAVSSPNKTRQTASKIIPRFFGIFIVASSFVMLTCYDGWGDRRRAEGLEDDLDCHPRNPALLLSLTRSLESQIATIAILEGICGEKARPFGTDLRQMSNCR